MRRIFPFVGLGVLLTAVFVSGLATVRDWHGRGAWSDDPTVRRGQSFLVIGLGGGVMLVMTINSLLNPPPRKSDDRGPSPKDLGDFDP